VRKIDSSSYARKWSILTFWKNETHFKCNSQNCLSLFSCTYDFLKPSLTVLSLCTPPVQQDTIVHRSRHVIHTCVYPFTALCILNMCIPTISLCQASSKKQKQQDVWRQREGLFILGTGSCICEVLARPKSTGSAWRFCRLETQERVAAWVQRPCWFTSLFLPKITPSTDQMSPSHIMKNSLLYSVSTALNINLTWKKYFHQNIWNNVWPNIWISWLSQVDI